MARLVFDIETVGEDFDSLDKTSQEALSWWIEKEAATEAEYKKTLGEMKGRMGFSPLTAEIVALGVLDYERNQGAVCFQAPGEEVKEFEEDGFKFKQMSEKEMLENFWQGANQYDEFISFNGRGFDVPFLVVRSAVHNIRPTKDLMSNRYLSSQTFGAKHVDLLDQLTFYGTMRKRGNLHLWSRVFGIKSPKAEGIKGEDVGRLYKEKKFLDIARYNVADLRATKELYDYWRNYFRF